VNRVAFTFVALFALLATGRLCHTGVLWAEETLPLAAAQQMHHGQTLYRDLWFDKPPATALVAWIAGGRAGVLLRLIGALYGLLCCWLAFAFARDLWDHRAGLAAALLTGFYLTFDFPSTAIPLASDLLMVAPHLAALWMASRGRGFIAGVLAGTALWVSPKGVIVLAACLIWAPPAPVFAGFAAITAAGALWLALAGALPAYWDEVYRWGRVYAGTTFLENPIANGFTRTLNWLGFHSALVCAGLFGLPRERRPWLIWLGLCAASAAAGLRFFPRYYFALLPPLLLLAARGFTLHPRRARWSALLLLIPLIRFAPAYYQTARGPWRDTLMDQDSRAAAELVRRDAHPGDSLFVWGYRPEVYVYSELPAANRYLDSQPLTGVPADRHLTQSAPVETAESRRHREELAHSQPAWIVDGLGRYNPKLALTAYPDLANFLARYTEAGRTPQSIVYRRVR
jgi:hypothetical protein